MSFCKEYSSMFSTFVVLALTVILPIYLAIDVSESSTGALLTFPYLSEDGPALYGVSWEVAPAQFGYQQYGGNLEAFLVIPMNTTYHLECDSGEPQYITTATNLSSDGSSELANPYIHRIKDYDISSSGVTEFIFVIDRGDCYFVDKIENAEALGAAGVIVCDKTTESLFTMWMPESWTDDISIPSVLLQEENCETLMSHLGVENWQPLEISLTSYPSIDNFTMTVARLEWGLPHPDDRVEWELWTSANDEDAVHFKRNFHETSNLLDAQNDTIFEPHMYVLDGSHWHCTLSSLPCGKQCTNNGRYCSVDPEFDLTIGLDGMDVVQENLRSLCVWEFDKNYSKANNNILWWNYTVHWDEFCFMPDVEIPNTTFTENCSFTQMILIHPEPYNDGEPTLHEYVMNCINDTGGYEYDGGVNTLLAAEAQLRIDSSVYALPMVRVNEFMIHGNINCSTVTIQECMVLSAICAGFLNGTLPDLCFYTPAPTAMSCSDSLKDCKGDCYGSYELDQCEQCLLVGNSAFDACVGCDDIVNSTKVINPCGYCVLLNITDFESYGEDCNGECNGDRHIDDCGHCLLFSSDSFNDCSDSGSSSSSETDKMLTTVIIAVCVITFLVVVCAGIIIYCLWKRQLSITDRFNTLASTYQMMDDIPVDQQSPQSSTLQQTSTKKGNKGYVQTVPDDEVFDGESDLPQNV